jgi:hypothetical protein
MNAKLTLNQQMREVGVQPTGTNIISGQIWLIGKYQGKVVSGSGKTAQEALRNLVSACQK